MLIKLALVAGAFALAAPAYAATVLVTMTGRISSGQDATGVFGSPGDLAGQNLKVVYTASFAGHGTRSRQGPGEMHSEGGLGYNTGGSPVSAEVTINGTTQYISGYFAGEAWALDNVQYGYDLLYFYASDYGFIPNGIANKRVSSSVQSYVNDFLSSGSYTEPLAYRLGAGDSHYGSMYFDTYDFDIGQTAFASANFTVSAVRIAELRVGGVPEPSSWSLLIIGFGILGGAMRTRRLPTLAFR